MAKRLHISPEEKESAVEQFKTLFPKELVQGTILDFTWRQGEALIVSVNQKVIGTCDSQAMARALFESYLDKDSKATQPKGKWGDGLISLKE